MKPKNSSNLALIKGLFVLAALWVICLVLLPFSVLVLAAAKIREICSKKLDAPNISDYSLTYKPATTDNTIHSAN